jgi:hypothetical protein
MADIQVPDPQEAEERKAKVFTRRVALTTGIYAVALAIASLGGQNALKDMLLASQQAADQWSFFQAKAVRQHLYKLEAQRIDAELEVRKSSIAPDVRQKLEHLRAAHEKNAKRYRKERDAISVEAKKLEKERESNRVKDPYFDYAGVLLQIAIILASIAMLAESRAVFWFSLAGAIGGTGLTVAGFLVG